MHALAAEEHGQRLSDDELIPSLFRRAYGDRGAGSGGADCDGGHSSASSPAYKIAIKQCPDCKRAWQYSGGRDIEVDPAVAECAACDAIHLGSLDAGTPERATATVTARKREQVLARDGHCCTVPGCRRTVGLDLHHIAYQSRGGGHELRNLTTTCDLHHRAIHFGKLVIRGTAPDHLTFEFRSPRDRRNVTDDDAPAPNIPQASAAPTSPARSPAGSPSADASLAAAAGVPASPPAGSRSADALLPAAPAASPPAGSRSADASLPAAAVPAASAPAGSRSADASLPAAAAAGAPASAPAGSRSADASLAAAAAPPAGAPAGSRSADASLPAAAVPAAGPPAVPPAHDGAASSPAAGISPGGPTWASHCSPSWAPDTPLHHDARGLPAFDAAGEPGQLRSPLHRSGRCGTESHRARPARSEPRPSS
jgi:hypothetical protein